MHPYGLTIPALCLRPLSMASERHGFKSACTFSRTGRPAHGKLSATASQFHALLLSLAPLFEETCLCPSLIKTPRFLSHPRAYTQLEDGERDNTKSAEISPSCRNPVFKFSSGLISGCQRSRSGKKWSVPGRSICTWFSTLTCHRVPWYSEPTTACLQIRVRPHSSEGVRQQHAVCIQNKQP